MSEQEYDKEQLRIMRNAFKAFDHDDRGFIEHSDVIQILEILGQKLDEKAVKALIKEVDKGNSSQLDFSQFCKLAARFVEVEEDGPALMGELKEAFRVYDKEGKGYLTVETLRGILQELDDKLSSQELDMIIEEIDADGSGTVDFDEFMQVMTVMRNAFKAFDKDDKGFIAHTDVMEILAILGQKLDDKAVLKLIKEVDKGSSGKLNFAQFCKLASRFVEVDEDGPVLMGELKEAFRIYDKEGKGYITVQILRGILHELDDKLSTQELDMIIEEIDSDGSGTVDFDEFVQVMTVLGNAFKAFDAEDKGFIEYSDVMKILEILGQKLDDKAVKALIKEVDKANSGKLNFKQFCKLAARFVDVEEDGPVLVGELKEAFRIYDKEGKGYITVQILRDILHELDDKLSKQELDMIIEEIDSDGSGTVDFDEFMQVMTG